MFRKRFKRLDVKGGDSSMKKAYLIILGIAVIAGVALSFALNMGA